MSGAASSNGQRLAAGSGDGTISVWETTSAGRQTSFELGSRTPVRAVAFGKSEFLAAAGIDGSVRIYQSDDKPVGSSAARSGKRVFALGYDAAPDQFVALTVSQSGSADGARNYAAAIERWSASTGNLAGESVLLGASADGILAAAVAANGSRAAIVTATTVQVWDIGGGRARSLLKESRAVSPRSLSFSDDGTLFAVADDDGRLLATDSAQSTVLREVTGSGACKAVSALALSSRRSQIAALCGDGAIRLLPVGGGRSAKEIAGPAGENNRWMAFLPADGDDRLLAVAWDDGTVHVLAVD